MVMERQMILLRKYRIRKSSDRGHSITIPNEYLEDTGFQAGQKLAMYRDGDSLVLIPDSKPVKAEEDSKSI